MTDRYDLRYEHWCELKGIEEKFRDDSLYKFTYESEQRTINAKTILGIILGKLI